MDWRGKRPGSFRRRDVPTVRAEGFNRQRGADGPRCRGCPRWQRVGTTSRRRSRPLPQRRVREHSRQRGAAGVGGLGDVTRTRRPDAPGHAQPRSCRLRERAVCHDCLGEGDAELVVRDFDRREQRRRFLARDARCRSHPGAGKSSHTTDRRTAGPQDQLPARRGERRPVDWDGQGDGAMDRNGGHAFGRPGGTACRAGADDDPGQRIQHLDCRWGPRAAAGESSRHHRVGRPTRLVAADTSRPCSKIETGISGWEPTAGSSVGATRCLRRIQRRRGCLPRAWARSTWMRPSGRGLRRPSGGLYSMHAGAITRITEAGLDRRCHLFDRRRRWRGLGRSTTGWSDAPRMHARPDSRPNGSRARMDWLRTASTPFIGRATAPCGPGH